MVSNRSNSLAGLRLTEALLVVVWLNVLFSGVFRWPFVIISNPGPTGDEIIRNTIRLALTLYFAATILMLRLRPEQWLGSRPARIARLVWTLAWITFVIHVLVSF